MNAASLVLTAAALLVAVCNGVEEALVGTDPVLGVATRVPLAAISHCNVSNPRALDAFLRRAKDLTCAGGVQPTSIRCETARMSPRTLNVSAGRCLPEALDMLREEYLSQRGECDFSKYM